MTKDHLGSIIIAAAIVLAAIIYAFATRYEIAGAGNFIYVSDRWTGQVHAQ